MARRRTARAVDDTDDQLEPAVMEPGGMMLTAADDDDGPDNARDVPMFADIDGRTSRSIVYLRLLKLEPGGPPAYKGMIPLNSTLDSIGNVYGDGIYTIEGLNHKHTVLATKDNIRISLATVEQQSKAGDGRQLSIPGTGDSERIERLALRAADESRQLSQDFTKLTVATMESAAERERNFYAASRDQMTSMFAHLMQMQQDSFRQTVHMMATSHNQTLESLNVTAKIRRAESGDSTEMVEMLLRGLQMGRELGSGQDEKPMWEQILANGANLLAAAKPGLVGPALPANAQQNPGEAPVGKRLSRKAKAEIREALVLLRKVKAKGIDPEDLLNGLSAVGNGPPDDESDEDDDDEQDTDTDAEDTRVAESGHFDS